MAEYGSVEYFKDRLDKEQAQVSQNLQRAKPIFEAKGVTYTDNDAETLNNFATILVENGHIDTSAINAAHVANAKQALTEKYGSETDFTNSAYFFAASPEQQEKAMMSFMQAPNAALENQNDSQDMVLVSQNSKGDLVTFNAKSGALKSTEKTETFAYAQQPVSTDHDALTL